MKGYYHFKIESDRVERMINSGSKTIPFELKRGAIIRLPISQMIIGEFVKSSNELVIGGHYDVYIKNWLFKANDISPLDVADAQFVRE